MVKMHRQKERAVVAGSEDAMKKNRCPKCGEFTIDAWEKSGSGTLLPVMCPNCGAKLVVTGSLNEIMIQIQGFGSMIWVLIVFSFAWVYGWIGFVITAVLAASFYFGCQLVIALFCPLVEIDNK